MIRWWHPERYHGEPYHNWLVGRFDRAGQLQLYLSHSQTDRVESCWLVELATTGEPGAAKRIKLGSSASGQYRIDRRFEPQTAFAIRFEHRPLLPSFQSQRLVLGRVEFSPDDAATEDHDLTILPARGPRTVMAPEAAIDAVRHLLLCGQREGAPTDISAIRLYPSGEKNLEIRLNAPMDCDVLLFTGERLPDASPGQNILVEHLELAGLARLDLIEAGRRFKKTRRPAGEFIVAPVAVEKDHRRGILGNPVRFALIPPVSQIKGRFVDNGELQLCWNWQGNTRVRVLVRPDGSRRGGAREPLGTQTTAREYADRNYFLVAREWLDSVIERERCTKLEITIESLHHDDAGGVGQVFAARSTLLTIPKRRLQR